MLFSCLFCLLSRESVYTVLNFDQMYIEFGCMSLGFITREVFRLVSTELLEGDFNTCANTKRDNTKGDTKLPKRALLGEKQDKHLSR